MPFGGRKGSSVSKRGLQRERFGIRKHFQPRWVPHQSLVAAPPPPPPPLPSMPTLTNYVWLSCAFPSHIKTFRPRAMWIISQLSSWAVHQEQTQTSRPDQKNLLVLDRRLLHLGDLMHPLSAPCISCVRSFSACRLWSQKFPYPAANL